MLNAIHMDDFIEIGEVINIPLDKFVTFDTNKYYCSSSVNDVMVNWVNLLF